MEENKREVSGERSKVSGRNDVFQEKKMIKIIMDDREPKVMELIGKMKGVEFKRRRLKVGDYLCDGCPDVVVERKTIDDFCGSIINGRFKKQVEGMKKYKWRYVLVSGRIKDRTTEIHEHCVLGKIVSLLINHDVRVICVDDDWQLVYIMRRIFERHMEVGK